MAVQTKQNWEEAASAVELCVCQAPAGSRDCSASRRSRKKRKERRERLNVCYKQGSLFALECSSRVSLVYFCHSQSFHFSPCSTTTSTFCLRAFLFPSSSYRFSSAIFSHPLIKHSLLHLSLSIRSLSPPSLGSQSIYYSAKWAYQLSRVLLIEAVTDNE